MTQFERLTHDALRYLRHLFLFIRRRLPGHHSFSVGGGVAGRLSEEGSFIVHHLSSIRSDWVYPKISAGGLTD
jgi:hypothetical protein